MKGVFDEFTIEDVTLKIEEYLIPYLQNIEIVNI